MRKFCKDCVHWAGTVPWLLDSHRCSFKTHCSWDYYSHFEKSNMDPEIHNARNDCEHFERINVEETPGLQSKERSVEVHGVVMIVAFVALTVVTYIVLELIG